MDYRGRTIMKKTFKVIAVTLVLCTAEIGFSGCHLSLNLKPNSQASDSSTVIEEDTTVAETTEEETTESSSDKEFADIQEYIDYPVNSEALENVKESFEDTIDFNYYADGDTLVYEYTYVDQISESALDTVKESLDDSIESLSSTYKITIRDIVSRVDVEDPKFCVRYNNADGTLITERTFDKTLLDE